MRIYFIFTQFLFGLLGASANAATHLILFGGGPRPGEALQQFVRWSGAENSEILVIAWATKFPEQVLPGVMGDLRAQGAVAAHASSAPPVSEGEKQEFLHQLSEARGVFFTGGDQGRIMSVLQDSRLKWALQSSYEGGVAFAGTSAGMAIMSQVMIAGDTLPLGRGLGLLPGSIVDSHFLKRARQGRLVQALSCNPGLLGIGVDEGAALAIVDNTYSRVMGPEKVDFFGRREMLLEQGDCYELAPFPGRIDPNCRVSPLDLW